MRSPLAAPLLCLILAASAWGADPPLAVLAGPARAVPAGSAVVLDASKSISAYELTWSVSPATPLLAVDRPPQRFAFLPQPAEGEYLITVTALGLTPDGKAPAGHSATIRVIVGAAPVPGPNPAPAPLPAPAGPFQDFGRQYGAALVLTYVQTMEESRTMLAAGSSRADLNASFDARWKARRVELYRPVAAAFARVAPDGAEPSGAARDALLQAWTDFIVGLREALR